MIGSQRRKRQRLLAADASAPRIERHRKQKSFCVFFFKKRRIFFFEKKQHESQAKRTPAHIDKRDAAMLRWPDAVSGTLSRLQHLPDWFAIDTPMPDGLLQRMALAVSPVRPHAAVAGAGA